ncbi:MAG TPA: prolyl oligopeptidase family serine peptidase [Candidatus Hydrogenedens sp.]|nr:prolyl oligopeptidase family serine peptidase [Candidatus Hydrogenedens sp.]HOK08801.1 prolyl oligopeptidase family serine peptidase [Candidatus Hydrogenedens sp.]HOL18713.1 prolyl oligopeptidase family serine peptidase [Candidatus Hydrogenedens sp.]HPP58490.1 prolyl oligopeptidase family serine peptidase [Candidatus Hydrogenedens sp.]
MKEEPKKTHVYLRPVQELYNPASKLTIRPKTKGLFVHEPHCIYAEAYGIALTMDIFKPIGKSNGIGIIDVVSNGWFSDRHQLIQHIGLGLYDVLCGQGYCVFALSPGSIQIFNGIQMIHNVQAGIQFIIRNADRFDIDKNRLGIMGISAGGHLAMNALLREPKFIGSATDGIKFLYEYIKTIALFCSPVDLLSFYSMTTSSWEIQTILLRLIRKKSFLEDEIEPPAEEIEPRLKDLSPFFFPFEDITSPPSVFLFHGTKDSLVPFSQSEHFYKKLKSYQWNCNLITKENVEHIWKDMSRDFDYLGKQFSMQLTK